jgi:hypothetical protein
MADRIISEAVYQQVVQALTNMTRIAKAASIGVTRNLSRLEKADAALTALQALPEVQPQAWVEAEPSARKATSQEILKGRAYWTRWHFGATPPERPQPNNALLAIYAFPVSEKGAKE